MANPEALISMNRAFRCPHCNAFAYQEFEGIWTNFFSTRIAPGARALEFQDGRVMFSMCAHCKRPAIWVSDKMVFPSTPEYPVAHEDMPDNIKVIYDEAGSIVALSPRAACALLRLALQMLLKQLGESGDINRAIDNLEKKGLDPGTKEAMHILRVTGNHAIHPGKISFDGDTDTGELFKLLNAIVMELITLPRTRAELFDSLPESDRKFIEKKESRTN